MWGNFLNGFGGGLAAGALSKGASAGPESDIWQAQLARMFGGDGGRAIAQVGQGLGGPLGSGLSAGGQALFDRASRQEAEQERARAEESRSTKLKDKNAQTRAILAAMGFKGDLGDTNIINNVDDNPLQAAQRAARLYSDINPEPKAAKPRERYRVVDGRVIDMEAEGGPSVAIDRSARRARRRTEDPRQTGNVNQEVMDLLGQLRSTSGQDLPVTSGFRSSAKNAQVGGAKGSQHLTGNAVDVDVANLSREQRRELIRMASELGFGGIGVYDNAMHFDVGPRRAWGPSYSRDSVPEWAVPMIQMHIANQIAQEQGGQPQGVPQNFAAPSAAPQGAPQAPQAAPQAPAPVQAQPAQTPMPETVAPAVPGLVPGGGRQRTAPQVDPAGALAEAQDAIAKGAPPDAVRKRLEELGITPNF